MVILSNRCIVFLLCFLLGYGVSYAFKEKLFSVGIISVDDLNSPQVWYLASTLPDLNVAELYVGSDTIKVLQVVLPGTRVVSHYDVQLDGHVENWALL